MRYHTGKCDRSVCSSFIVFLMFHLIIFVIQAIYYSDLKNKSLVYFFAFYSRLVMFVISMLNECAFVKK